MRKTILNTAILSLIVLPSLSFISCSAPTRSGTIVKKDAAQTARAERMRLAIIDFTAKGISRADAEMVNDLLRGKMINTGEFIVLERSQMKEIMKEQSFQMTGTADTRFAVKVGRLLSARKILVGTISQWRSKILITGRIIDVEKGVADFAHDETIDNIEDLDKGISLFVLNLTSRIQGRSVVAIKREERGADKNFAWIDLGKKDNGHLLALAPNDGAAITEPDVKAGVDCRKLPYPYSGPGHNHLCFDIDDSFMWGAIMRSGSSWSISTAGRRSTASMTATARGPWTEPSGDRPTGRFQN